VSMGPASPILLFNIARFANLNQAAEGRDRRKRCSGATFRMKG
jgi:hypothetical protein